MGQLIVLFRSSDLDACEYDFGEIEKSIFSNLYPWTIFNLNFSVVNNFIQKLISSSKRM